MRIYSRVLSIDEIRSLSGFFPSHQPANLKLWLKADGGTFSDAGTSPATNNGSIQQWNDSSGNGLHVSQTNGSSQPLWIANAINGKPAVQFNGSTYLQRDSLVGTSLFATNEVDIFIVQVDTGQVINP